MIKITADSTCDLSRELIEKHNITIVPINIVIGHDVYKDGEEITTVELLEKMEAGVACKTNAANSYEYQKCFDKYRSQYDAIIHISLGSGFSSSYNNAILASKEMDNVYVVDSKNLSTGSGHIVMQAVDMANAGMTATDIVKELNEIVPRVDASFVIDDMQYLYHGGRCSGLGYYGAKLLRIKPCIEVKNNGMNAGRKFIGKFEKVIKEYVKVRLSDSNNIDKTRVFITHPNCHKEIVDMVIKLVKQSIPFKEVIETNAGSTVTCHCGANTLGVLFIKNK